MNTASRIEQLNKEMGTRVLATQVVVDAVPGLAIRPLGRFRLFGKVEVLTTAEILERRDERLTARFGEALACFGRRDWERAADLFSNLDDVFDDRAARLYHETCRLYLDGPPSLDRDGIIHLKSK